MYSRTSNRSHFQFHFYQIIASRKKFPIFPNSLFKEKTDATEGGTVGQPELSLVILYLLLYFTQSFQLVEIRQLQLVKQNI